MKFEEGMERERRNRMCTLIAIYRTVPGRWLVLAANRDEYLDRPAEGPAIRVLEKGAVLAPLDLKAGGTWIGMNPSGVLCALTNLSGGENDPSRLSRGKIVTDCLSQTRAADAAETLRRLGQDEYNAFNCFVCDRDSAFVAVYRGLARVEALEEGVHVIGNADALSSPVPKVERLEKQVRALVAGPDEDLLGRLGDVCREHGAAKNELDETCVHLADTYGTRSSMLIELGDEFGQVVPDAVSGSRFFYSDGPPCAAPYENLSPLLREFERMPNNETAEFLARNAS